VAEIHHVLEGDPEAPVLVLGPSLGTELAMWDPQARRLSERFRVLRFDLRGHGATPPTPGPYAIADLAGDVLELLDRLEIERAAVGGISIGGMIGIWLAAHAPERVSRLAVCCTSALIDPEHTYLDRAKLVRERGVRAVADAVMRRWFTPAFATGRPERFAAMRAALLRVSAEGYAGCCEALAEMDLRAELGSVLAPTLVIAGAEDPATPPAHGRLIADGVAGARFALVEHAMHLANVEQPDAVGALMQEFLDEEEEP
jgi:3-oxoadipate enol-lactonase